MAASTRISAVGGRASMTVVEERFGDPPKTAAALGRSHVRRYGALPCWPSRELQTFVGIDEVQAGRAVASMTMPISIVIASRPSMSSVVAAFLLFGGLNAGTPLAMASTPVSAVQPEENVRTISHPKARRTRPRLHSPDDRYRARSTPRRMSAGTARIDADHEQNRAHERVRRDRERRPALADAAQVRGGQQHHEPPRCRPCVPGARSMRRGVLSRRRRPTPRRSGRSRRAARSRRSGRTTGRGSWSRPRSRRRRSGRRAPSAGRTRRR